MKAMQKQSLKGRGAGNVLNFSGKTVYRYVQEIGNNVLSDQFCPNTIKITFLDSQKMKLFITESGVCGGRSFYAFGEMTESGSVMFEYAVPVITLPDGTNMKITEVIMGHLGGSISGEGIDRGTLVFKGRFDGYRLIATSNFILKCEVEWPANNIFPTPVNGQIQGSWTFDLTVEA